MYGDDELLRLRDMVPATGETYVLFNNIPRADDARRFSLLVGEHSEGHSPSACLLSG